MQCITPVFVVLFVDLRPMRWNEAVWFFGMAPVMLSNYAIGVLLPLKVTCSCSSIRYWLNELCITDTNVQLQLKDFVRDLDLNAKCIGVPVTPTFACAVVIFMLPAVVSWLWILRADSAIWAS